MNVNYSTDLRLLLRHPVSWIYYQLPLKILVSAIKEEWNNQNWIADLRIRIRLEGLRIQFLIQSIFSDPDPVFMQGRIGIRSNRIWSNNLNAVV